jgi:hypothetical protein
MQPQFNYSTKPLKKGKHFVTSWGRGEGMNSTIRYIQQLQNMLRTARRMELSRVVFALSSLIASKRGIA